MEIEKSNNISKRVRKPEEEEKKMKLSAWKCLGLSRIASFNYREDNEIFKIKMQSQHQALSSSSSSCNVYMRRSEYILLILVVRKKRKDSLGARGVG